MIGLTVHNIVAIHITETQGLTTDTGDRHKFITRDIVITDSKGRKLVIDLFADPETGDLQIEHIEGKI